METKLSGLFIGTSGWSYKHWSEIFYPENIKPDQYPGHYLTKFDCVELNSSFYHLRRETTIAGWVQRAPRTFKFCPKLSRFITHQKRLFYNDYHGYATKNALQLKDIISTDIIANR